MWAGNPRCSRGHVGEESSNSSTTMSVTLVDLVKQNVTTKEPIERQDEYLL